METVKTIFAIIVLFITFVSTAAPLVVKLVIANKARKAAAEEIANAKTETELAEAETAKEKAMNDMIETAHEFVRAAEKAYSGFDAVMKTQNSTAGDMKKEHVTTKLQMYALARGYEYDEEFWSNKVDELVAFTREVNAKKKTNIV